MLPHDLSTILRAMNAVQHVLSLLPCQRPNFPPDQRENSFETSGQTWTQYVARQYREHHLSLQSLPLIHWRQAVAD